MPTMLYHPVRDRIPKDPKMKIKKIMNDLKRDRDKLPKNVP